MILRIVIATILLQIVNSRKIQLLKSNRSDDMFLERFKRDITDSSSINNIEKNSRVKFYIERQNPSIDIEKMKRIEFTKHPEDTLITGKLPVLVECEAKNSVQTQIECNSRVRDDVKRNITKKNDIKYEHLSILVKRKDVETTLNNEINRKIICKCIAYSEFNEKIISNKAVIKTAFMDDEFQSEPMDEVSYEGETIEMRCDPPLGEPTPNVYWLKDGQEIETNSDSSRFKLSNDYSLLILASRKSDSGSYSCVASNLIDKRISKPAKLTLLDPTKKYEWSEWSKWSDCSAKCGEGIQKRNRNCQTSRNLAQIEKVAFNLCENGPSTEDRKCVIRKCEPKWSEWSSWSQCNAECKQYRRRFCENESIDADYPESFSLDKPSTKSCIGEKMMTRNCCKSVETNSAAKINVNKLGAEETNKISKTDNFDQTFLKLSIGLTASILLISLFILIVVLIYLLKRGKPRQNNNSELNLYYTCEKQFPIEDDCSIYKFSKTSNSTTGSSGCSSVSRYKNGLVKTKESIAPVIYCDSNRIFNNQNFESQLLLGNVSQHYQIVPNSSLIKSPKFLNPNSSSLSSNTSKNVTNTTVTSSPSLYLNNDYVHLTNDLDDSNYVYNEFSISKSKSPLKNIQESSYANLSQQSLQRLVHLQQIKNKQDEELAYDIADATACYKTFLPINLYQQDVCIGNITSKGARLTLDCGISLLIPEGAVPQDQNYIIYIGICRNETFKPKLNDKSTYLSEVFEIGPLDGIKLQKPVILTMDHCVERIQNWDLRVHYSGNSFDKHPEWMDEKESFLNSTGNSFVLMTDKIGRLCITGEPISVLEAPKYFRLICFYSSSITSNEFSLRIYCIDNLLVALQEVLRDEKNIGGHLLETSDAFLLTNSNDLIRICIDDLNKKYFNCKYNVNFQEIPLNHVWNRRNHLLHCSFTLEKLKDLKDSMLNCRIKASIMNRELCCVSIGYDMKSLSSNYDNLSNVFLKNWTNEQNPTLDIINPKNLVKNYFKIDKNLKKQLCTILDDSYRLDKNWKTLANKLNIKRNLNYFACRTSPTEMLLLYFEAISDLKCHDLIRLNNELIKTNNNSTSFSIDRFSSPQEVLFREIFLKNIL